MTYGSSTYRLSTYRLSICRFLICGFLVLGISSSLFAQTQANSSLGSSSDTILLDFPNVKWEKLTTHKGIRVFQGQRKDSPLPLLKGEGRLNLNLYEIMAVV